VGSSLNLPRAFPPGRLLYRSISTGTAQVPERDLKHTREHALA
jgi:hypothetical protein